MDTIRLFGGEPANFLDLGGGATHEQILEALKLLEKDENVKVIVINIFGGILSCDKIASTLLHAVEEVTPTKPIIMRLKGTHSESAKRMIE
jgi:succinyl-CoA synthetase beta subunit